ncbi:hypothetical protein OSSY52_11860 [Tepiditoga spiralis]|uniref:CAAX prenyl protease 2/Lysostaphin resistance protein A-like domain-containing protein n=1 Tax=Tepiditoga spiralis TaxID=2108365 RepID=A0A7G1G4L3_9BACT|nr:type II CAAX endopeptidase family protein [Tepiditoga spiralis]BBE31045.1 hypothetical protein OSSY52_11860 [Tepiditoga spiralis]
MNYNNEYNKKDKWLFFILLSFLPVFSALFLSILSLTLLNNLNLSVKSILSVLFSMGISMILLPSLLVKKRFKNSLKKFGLSITIEFFDIVFLILIFFIIMSFQIFYHSIDFFKTILFQTIVVAISEEFWARGILINYLNKIINSKFMILSISSFIFAFITHINNPIVDNLIWRFPMGFLLGYLYMKSGKLWIPIGLHLCNNMISLYI